MYWNTLGFHPKPHEGSPPSTRQGPRPLTLALVCPADKPIRCQLAIADMNLVVSGAKHTKRIGPALKPAELSSRAPES